jgi:SAM-dependent methyltransferase
MEKEYRSEVCNICGSTAYRRTHYFAKWNLGREPVRGVSIVRCGECGVRRRMPGIVDVYDGEYHVPYLKQGSSIHPHQLSHFADLMTARLRQLEQQQAAFLDVGCSTGRVLRLAAASGFAVTGLDYSEWAAEYCRKQGFDVRCGSLLDQWQEGEIFDVIHCSHTIEHVPDPVAYIREMHRLLKSDGQLMIAFPNYASIQRVILGNRWGPWCLDSHLWHFTGGQMCKLLRNHGFIVASCRTLHGYTPDSPLKKRLLDLAALAGYGDGCNIIATKA